MALQPAVYIAATFRLSMICILNKKTILRVRHLVFVYVESIQIDRMYWLLAILTVIATHQELPGRNQDHSSHIAIEFVFRSFCWRRFRWTGSR